jgi:hypothetical protein
MGGTGSGEQQGLGPRIDFPLPVFEHQGTELLPNGSASGFPCAHHCPAALLKRAAQSADLG